MANRAESNPTTSPSITQGGRLTPELISHYNRPGPRYTSYPTAPLMKESFDPATYGEALSTGSSTRPLSLYFHLPFCKSLCLYCGCHMMVTNQPERIEQYLEFLFREIEMVSGTVSGDRVVTHLHWGGGTPTYLGANQMSRLIAHIRESFRIAPEGEVGVEADPRTLTAEHVEVLREGGFNRVSLGVQDLDPDVQQAIGRIQPESLVAESMRMLRDAGFDRISLDLIYGLPHQSRASFRQTLEHVVAMGPERLSLFSYAHVPWLKKHQRAIPSDALPSPVEKLELFLDAIDYLTDAGYRHVGMDHFARSDDPLCVAQDEGRLHRNFQGYATDAGCDLLGLGLSSISQLDRMY
ncbi:MAG TPA: oxygen-independent coproporphyrinogen III oxidase, partial [Rhodothermales bacterium]